MLNLKQLFLLTTSLWQLLLAPAPLPPDTINAGYEWQFASPCCESFDLWRQEMNYWYDQCVALKNFSHDESIDEKIDLLRKNKELEEDNKILEETLNSKYPKLNQLDDYDLKKMAADKDVELFKLKQGQVDRSIETRKEITAHEQEIERLEAELETAKAEFQKLNLDPDKINLSDLEEHQTLLAEKLELEKQLAQKENQATRQELDDFRAKTNEIRLRGQKVLDKVKAMSKKR